MHKKASILGIASLLASPAVAASNTVVIEQVGPGSVVVHQSIGGNNSVEVRQGAEDTKAVDKDKFDEKAAAAKKAKKPVDYNKAVINDPNVSTRARTLSIIERNAPSGNSIKIYQSGEHNTSVTNQQGDDNTLLLEQEGKTNEAVRVQEGTHNRAKIIRNGEVIEDEDNETDEEKQ